MAIGDKVDHDFEALWQQCLDQAAGTAPRPELTPDEEWRQAYNAANAPLTGDEQKLADALAAWDTFDDSVAPGGPFANASPSEKRRLESAAYLDHGPRPDKQVALDFAARRAAEKRADQARARDPAEWAGVRAANEAWTAQMLEDGGYANIDDARKGIKAPVPSLIQTEQGVPAYVMPDGSLVEEYAVAFGKAAKNPKFAEIQARVQKIQGARR